MSQKQQRAMVVLDDGETFTKIEGCTVQWAPEELIDDDLDYAIRDGDLESEPVLSGSDAIRAAAKLIEEKPREGKYVLALYEICNALRGRTVIDMFKTMCEIRNEWDGREPPPTKESRPGISVHELIWRCAIFGVSSEVLAADEPYAAVAEIVAQSKERYVEAEVAKRGRPKGVPSPELQFEALLELIRAGADLDLPEIWNLSGSLARAHGTLAGGDVEEKRFSALWPTNRAAWPI